MGNPAIRISSSTTQKLEASGYSVVTPLTRVRFSGLSKSAAIRGSARDVVIDERIAVGLDLMSASVPTMLRLLYPTLYVVHDPSGDWGKPVKGSGK